MSEEPTRYVRLYFVGVFVAAFPREDVQNGGEIVFTVPHEMTVDMVWVDGVGGGSHKFGQPYVLHKGDTVTFTGLVIKRAE